MNEAAIAEPKTQCLACGTFQNVEPATLCEHCLAKATVLLKQGKTPAQIALGRDDIRAVLEGWQESREKSTMPKATNKTKKTVSRETPEATLAVVEETKAARSIAILIPIDAIEANPYQPRKIFSAQEMQELVDSIKEHGVLQPILVRPNPDDETRYQLIAGERRWRASQEAGLVEIEAVVRQKVSDQVMAEMAIIENVQRHDMSVIEQAVALRRLITEFNLTADYLAQRIGLSRSAVSNRLRLLDLPPEVQDRITAGQLSESHGRALVKYKRFPDFVSFYAGHIVKHEIPSKIVESGLHFQLSWLECNEFADDLEERDLLVELERYSFIKEDDLLFEHPDVIFRGSLEKDKAALFCLDVKLARTLHLQWKKREKEEQKAAAKNSKDEHAQKLANAMAKAKAGEIVYFCDLNFTQYQHVYDHSCPSTCNTQCECRAQAKHNESSEHVYQICLNPERLKELQKAEAETKKEARQVESAKLSDKIFPALDGYCDFALEDVILPVLVLSILKRADKEGLSAAAKRLGFEFDVELFLNRDTSEANRLDMLQAVPDLSRFAIEIMLRHELNNVAEFDWAKGDYAKWLIGVLEADNGD